MKLKDFKLFFVLLFFTFYSFSQNKVSGSVYEKDTDLILKNVSIYDLDKGLITTTDSLGNYQFVTLKKNITLVFIADGYQFIEKSISLNKNIILNIFFSNPIEKLSDNDLPYPKPIANADGVNFSVSK